MAKVFIEETTLTAIGDAIRGKTGKTELIDPANMSTEIAGIEAGGGGFEPSAEELTYSGDLNYLFRNGRFDWLINQYGHKMSTTDITKAQNMFENCTIEEIPFTINLKNVTSMEYLFNTCRKLRVCPKVRGTITWNTSTSFYVMLSSCESLVDIEDLFTPDMLDGFSTVKVTSAYSTIKPLTFPFMSSLRRIPSWYYKYRLNPESTAHPYSSAHLYSSTFASCEALDEITNFPVWVCAEALTSNYFGTTFSKPSRVNRITFETNEDGTPIVANWKAQTIDLTASVGYTPFSATNTSFIKLGVAGITLAHEVTNDATYQALKNDPNWFTNKVDYSRYNHDSAVETINSLPDTSAYLASNGGTNTIKFKGAAGAKTDGGAINTLTAEEIAVATAKGWTVTFA